MSGLDSPHSGADDAHATPGPKRGKGSSPRPVSVAPGAPAGAPDRLGLVIRRPWTARVDVAWRPPRATVVQTTFRRVGEKAAPAAAPSQGSRRARRARRCRAPPSPQ